MQRNIVIFEWQVNGENVVRVLFSGYYIEEGKLKFTSFFVGLSY